MSESNTDVFVKKTNEYVRDLNILDNYLNDTSLYLSISTGKPLEECRQYIIKQVKDGGKFQFKPPVVNFLSRKENGDREKLQTDLYVYLNDSVKKKEIIAPTLTTYTNPAIEESIVASYIEGKVKGRKIAKNEMFAAEAAKDTQLQIIKNIEQTNKKLGANSVSGMFVSPSTPVYNRTGHSTLTSMCRTTSSYGSANNEKFLSGNRHYWSHHVVLNNIINIINNTNYPALLNIINKYNIKYPTEEETFKCIKVSTSLYWWDERSYTKIKDLISKLNPLQRAAFVYTGDLFHLKELNPELVRKIICKLSSKIVSTVDNADIIIKTYSKEYLNLAHEICSAETRGIGKDYKTIKGTQAYQTLACTIKNIDETIHEYSDIIKTLWVTLNIPASVSNFPTSIRKCAIAGDTDSTIFTVQDWVYWYQGRLSFDDEATAVCSAMVFLASATVKHVLAIMSKNIGVEDAQLHRVEMKNEFTFPIFVPTNIGKHYYAIKSCQEGNVFDKLKMEIKGVNLKSSNSPVSIIKQAEAMMKDIMVTTMNTGKLSILKYLTEVANTEREIIASIKRGEFTYLRAGSIKDAASYTKDADKSPYQNHVFWNEVFGPKYGIMPNPPYSTLKFSLTTDTTKDFNRWVEGFQDVELGVRLKEFLKKNDKTLITTLNIPIQCLQMSGVPKEVLEVIDYKRIVGDICKIFYIILETLGVYLQQKKVKRLASDYY